MSFSLSEAVVRRLRRVTNRSRFVDAFLLDSFQRAEQAAVLLAGQGWRRDMVEELLEVFDELEITLPMPVQSQMEALVIVHLKEKGMRKEDLDFWVMALKEFERDPRIAQAFYDLGRLCRFGYTYPLHILEALSA